MQSNRTIDGLVERLAAFIGDSTGRPARVSDLVRYPAGLSWITYGFTAQIRGEAPRELILRVGDPSGLLSPYRARPEFLALTTLAGVPELPIPKEHWYSDDAAILGAPFIVTERVAGDTPLPWRGAQDRGEASAALGHDFVDALVAIHGFEWRGSPLAELARGVEDGEVVAREIDLWTRHARVLEGRPIPLLHFAMRWLHTNRPEVRRVTVVHGDYRTGNFLRHQGRISAILDWELVHLGDPYEDLAWAGLRTWTGGTSRLGGLMTHGEFYERYEEKTGWSVDLRTVRYHEVLQQYKMVAHAGGGRCAHRGRSGPGPAHGGPGIPAGAGADRAGPAHRG